MINKHFLPALAISVFAHFATVPKSGLEWLNPTLIVIWSVFAFYPLLQKHRGKEKELDREMRILEKAIFGYELCDECRGYGAKAGTRATGRCEACLKKAKEVEVI